jgi:hypothetical protein
MLVVLLGDFDNRHGVDDGKAPQRLQHVAEQSQVLEQRTGMLSHMFRMINQSGAFYLFEIFSYASHAKTTEGFKTMLVWCPHHVGLLACQTRRRRRLFMIIVRMYVALLL